MTIHSRRNKRGRTEIDIATKYFEEEEEKTKAIMEKKKRQLASVSPKKTPLITKSSINTQIEKKKRKYPKNKIKRLHSNNLPTHSSRKNVIKKQKRRTVVKKSRERKKRLKRVRTQYSQRYNVQ
ncbi:MAG: hypothetical protein JSU57_02340 [Candidatus Heimdallarchaeota archaeon]|nr:MAG: hypothetical protein JSU57_02340 [Candidatus Heimdallarchaeota archaeon]